MHKKAAMLVLTLLVLSGTAAVIGACHTTAGAGEDISQAGQAIEKSANKHAP